MMFEVEMTKVEELLDALMAENYREKVIITKGLHKKYYGTLVTIPANA